MTPLDPGVLGDTDDKKRVMIRDEINYSVKKKEKEISCSN
jgi:hypothetical protein